jgi:flagella basal body P-ring formation protein FlgA
MTMALPFLLALSTPLPGCQILQTDAIFARDVAAVIPGFPQATGDLRLGYVPSTGAPRMLRGADLQRIAKNQGVDLPDPPDVCFALRTFIPKPSEMEAAMREALADVPGIANAKIEISSSSQRPVPFGDVIFPREGLQLPAGNSSEVMWRGFVRHGAEQFPVWARARITANTTRIVAAMNIPGGKPIQKGQVRLETCEDFLLDAATARNLDEVIGYIPKSTLRAYLPIRKNQIALPPDVAKGELVDVDVYAGAAHLMVKAKAETEGMKGSTILVRNLSSGREFSARVAGKNQAVVGNSVQ